MKTAEEIKREILGHNGFGQSYYEGNEQSLFDAMEEYASQSSPVTKEMSSRVAKLIIQMRDLLVEAKYTPLDTLDEIWHCLYQIASQDYEKHSDEVWKELESIADSPAKHKQQ